MRTRLRLHSCTHFVAGGDVNHTEVALKLHQSDFCGILFRTFSVIENGYLKQYGPASNLSWEAQFSSVQICNIYPFFIIRDMS